jgi:hypothetical protein
MSFETIKGNVGNACMSSAEQNILIQENDTQHFESDFHFLKEHRGWRPGKVHTVVAPTHSGKSTLTRSIAWDFLINNPFRKLFIWLSEESIDDFKTEFAKLRLPQELTSRLLLGSEQDIKGGVDTKKLMFAESLKQLMPDMVIFDNVTTSEFYMGQKPEAQGRFARYLKSKCKEENIPLVVIAHSGSDVGMNRRLIELNDIRGGKDIVNITEFAYVLKRFRVLDPQGNEIYFPTIRLEKHRGYVCKNLLFKLRFNPLTVSFQQDKPIPWQEFKEAFNEQLKL